MMDTITAIKKALEGVTPDRVERLWWFLHIMSRSSGTTNAEDDKWNWINAFCTDYEDDTFNRASKLGFIRVSHDSFMDTSTASMTPAGNAFIAYFDKAPSASVLSTLESLQRENDGLLPYKKELIRLADAVGEKNDPFAAWEHLEPAIARAETAESEVKRLREALEAAKKRMRNCRGAIESNQVVDKDVHGSLQNGIRDIDTALSSTGDTHGN